MCERWLAVICVSFLVGSVSKCIAQQPEEMSCRSETAPAAGVDAAELVRQVRQSENWVHNVRSLQIRMKSKWSKTGKGKAAKRADASDWACSPQMQADQFSEAEVTARGILEYAFDQERVRFLEEQSGRWRQLKVWDGKELLIHEENFARDQERYYLNSTPQGSFGELISSETSWLRTQPHCFWWDRQDTDELLDFFGRPEEFALAGRCNYRGIDCYVLEMRQTALQGLMNDQPYPGCEESVDQRRYGLVGEVRGLVGKSFRWYAGAKSGRLHGLVWLTNEKPTVEFWMSDYKEVAPGCWFPMIQGYQIYEKDKDGNVYVDSRRDLEALEVRANGQLSDDLFKTTLKAGVMVTDSRSGRTLEYIYEPEPEPLVGKVLPGFDGIQTTSGQAQRPNEMLLVCFLDIQQRPSRHCMKQLAAKATKLRERGVSILAVHTARIDPSSLSDWIGNCDIPFQVATITGDVKKTRSTWGVRSLPWLILNDGAQIIRAEGFPLVELDDRIQDIIKTSAKHNQESVADAPSSAG